MTDLTSTTRTLPTQEENENKCRGEEDSSENDNSSVEASIENIVDADIDVAAEQGLEERYVNANCPTTKRPRRPPERLTYSPFR